MAVQKRTRLSAHIVQKIMHDIDYGKYKSGEKLPSEYELIEKFGVSRTVIREVIANLRANGMIETKQGKGAFVLPRIESEHFQLRHTGVPVSDELNYILDLRIAIEAETALMAAKYRTEDDLISIKLAIDEMKSLIYKEKVSRQADRNFHHAIAIASKNPHFLELLRYLESRFDSQDQIVPNERKIQAIKEHEQICHAIELGDPDAARAAMRLHLSGTRERMTEHLVEE